MQKQDNSLQICLYKIIFWISGIKLSWLSLSWFYLSSISEDLEQKVFHVYNINTINLNIRYALLQISLIGSTLNTSIISDTFLASQSNKRSPFPTTIFRNVYLVPFFLNSSVFKITLTFIIISLANYIVFFILLSTR